MIKVTCKYIEANFVIRKIVFETEEVNLFINPKIPFDIWREAERVYPKLDEIRIQFQKGRFVDDFV